MASMQGAAKATTIDAAEVAQFSALARQWWDERGPFAPLHRINPLRIGYVRDMAQQHFGHLCSSDKIHAGTPAKKADSENRSGVYIAVHEQRKRKNPPFAASPSSEYSETATPLAKLSLLDVGCGGGLLCEPMTRLGAAVTGIDASVENIEAAKTHAKSQGLNINYQATTAEELAGLANHESRITNHEYDIVLALEIIEHVADLPLFYDAIAKLVKPGGLLILSTLNRTTKSFALGIIGAEVVLRWVPRGTHDWNKFVKPSEMADALTTRGLAIKDTTGMVFDPIAWKFRLNSRDLDVNYLLSACK